jgi:lysophospholipase L1-like esterase
MKGRIAKALLLAVSVALCLVVAEQVLKVGHFEYRPMSIDVVNPNDARLFHVFEDAHFIYDPEIIWRPKRSYEIFNAQGFRGPELAPEKPAGERRVFAVGDSNTLGWAGPDGPNWPGELAEKWRPLDARLQVVNAGVWGYSSFQGLVRYREVLSYQPDLILVSFGANDAHLVHRGDAEFSHGSLFGDRWARWLLHFRLAQLAAKAWDGGSRASGEERHRVEPEEYRANLREMIRLGREAGAETVLLTRPSIGEVRSPKWWKEFAAVYNLATVEVAEEEKVLVIDIYSFFKDQEKLFSDESHFNLEGHRRAASIIDLHLRRWVMDGAAAGRHAPRASDQAAEGGR